MKYVTRISPTVNGPLHLGHLYLTLVNEYEAHASGGEFIVRFDDNQRDWLALYGQEKIAEWKEQMIQDLSPYVTVDRWTSQAENEERYPLDRMPWPFAIRETAYMPIVVGPVPVGTYQVGPEYVPDRSMAFYPYAPPYTMERVFMDHEEGVNWLIRGVDLITEFSLYEFIREWFGYPVVRQTYLPRLRQMSGGQISPVSKMLGGHSIREETERLGVEGVLQVLRESCLIDLNGPFAVRNVKPDPRLVLDG